MSGHPGHIPKWHKERNEGKGLIPKEALEVVERIVAQGREAIVKKENGKWIVIENKRKIAFKEQ